MDEPLRARREHRARGHRKEVPGASEIITRGAECGPLSAIAWSKHRHAGQRCHVNAESPRVNGRANYNSIGLWRKASLGCPHVEIVYYSPGNRVSVITAGTLSHPSLRVGCRCKDKNTLVVVVCALKRRFQCTEPLVGHQSECVHLEV
jgi:hypothetical protein